MGRMMVSTPKKSNRSLRTTPTLLIARSSTPARSIKKVAISPKKVIKSVASNNNKKMVARASTSSKSVSKNSTKKNLAKSTTNINPKDGKKKVLRQRGSKLRGGVWFGGDGDMCGSLPLEFDAISIPVNLPAGNNVSHGVSTTASVISGQESLFGNYAMTTNFPTPPSSTNTPFIL